MKSMDESNTDERNMAIRYIQNDLTPEEQEQFEVTLLEHPERLESLELDHVFYTHLEGVRRAINHPSTIGEALARWLGTPWRASLATFACCAVLFSVMSITIPTNDNHADGTNDYAADWRNPTTVMLSMSRGLNEPADATVSMSADSTMLLIFLQDEFGKRAEYQVTVYDGKGTALYVAPNAQLSSDGDILLPIKADRISSGDLIIEYSEKGTPEAKRRLTLSVTQ